MGLDILRYGGDHVRVPVQGYLILLLGLFYATTAQAAREDYNLRSEALAACEQYASERQAATDGNPYDDTVWYCKDRGDRFHLFGRNTDGSEQGYAFTYYWQNEDPVCEPPNYVDVVSGQCVQVQEPEECFETGEIYNAETQTCVPQCEGMELDGFCLDPYDEEDDDDGKCTPEKEGYIGSYGSGNKKTHVCAPQKAECAANGGTYGIVNDVATCLPEGYGAPQCKSDTINDVLVNDGYGFFCETVGQPDTPDPEPEEPNTDTDGDGVPDEYQRENDPDAANKQRDQIIEGQQGTNDALDGIGDRLENLGNQGKEANDLLGDIEDGIGGINDKLDDMTEPPEGGFSIDSLTDAVPTISDSFASFGQTIAGTQVAEFATGLVSIPSSTSCPVYTMPGNDYWEPMQMSLHCEILSDYSGLFNAMFTFFWTGVAVFLFFRA